MSLLFQSLNQVWSRLSQNLGANRSIAKKIGVSYTLALGTAVLGTATGLLGGHYYTNSARMQAQQQLQKKQLLNDFENHLLNLELHPLRLLAIVGESSIWVEYEINQFKTELRQIERLLLDLDQIATQSQSTTELNALLTKARTTLQIYEQFAQNLWQQIAGVTQKQIAQELTAVTLSSRQANQLSTRFEQLSEDLTRLEQRAAQNYTQTTLQLQQAERLRLIIIVSSMVISIGLALALAAMTSRAIASPIEQLTTVAQQVTEDNNFQLRADINTQDEVSLLAQALNQLVSWAGQHTAELENARQTLEHRVQERTQALQQSEAELRQQATDLQDTLDELQQAQLQLVQSEKMSSLGQMVAGIAHEINNPVGFIHGNLGHIAQYSQDMMDLLKLYQQTYPQPSEQIEATIETIDLPFIATDIPRLMQSMRDGTTRIRDIVKSLRTFSRLDESAVKQVDLHDGLESTLTILSHRLKSTQNSPVTKIIRNYGQLPAIECYAGQLNQVLMNILSNAIDALEAKPQSEPRAITITTQAIDRDWVAITIADNGSGIPEAIQDRLFDPFFTTKTVGKGTGMGLSISYQIITEKHKGYLRYQPSANGGAEFVIKLPVTLPVEGQTKTGR